jgi:hypothetical protein
VTWATARGHHDADDQQLLLTTLTETGHVRQQTVDTTCARLTLTMLVKADDRAAAEHAGVRIGEVAHHAAGLGPVGLNLSTSATAHPAVDQDRR